MAIEFQVTFDSADPAAHAAFWAEALHYVPQPPPAGFDSWDVCDQVCSALFVSTPFAWAKAVAWAGRHEEFVKRAGFALMAALAVHDKAAPDRAFVALLRLIRREAGGLALHDLSRDGRLLVNDYFWHSGMVGSASDGIERDLAWMDQPYVNAISNDGRSVVFDEWGEGRGSSESIYLRAMDGSAAVHLGDGHGLAQSPDGRWILSLPSYSSDAFAMLPTGAGQPRSVPHRGIEVAHFARFFPDGRRIRFGGNTGSGPWHFYVQDLDGGAPRPV